MDNPVPVTHMEIARTLVTLTAAEVDAGGGNTAARRELQEFCRSLEGDDPGDLVLVAQGCAQLAILVGHVAGGSPRRATRIARKAVERSAATSAEHDV